MPDPTESKTKRRGGMGYTLHVQLRPDQSEIDRLRQRLRAYNAARGGEGQHRAFLISASDAGGEWAGGLYALTSYGWLFIDTLWVADECRGRGIGRQLLHTAEEQARSLGCRNAWVDTFSFQARPLYEKCGYSIFGELPDYPPGHARYFLRKTL